MIAAVDAVLSEIGAEEMPVEIVLNKIDAVGEVDRRRLGNRYPDSLQVSARTGEGLAELRSRIAERFEERFSLVELLVPYEDGSALSALYALGPPIELREDRADGVFVRARLPERDARRFAAYLVAGEAPAHAATVASAGS
jgi:GTP-binding protein HflX